MTKKSTCLHSFKLTCYKTAFGPSSNYECCFFSSQKSTPVIVGSDVMWCDVMRSSVLLYLHKAACRTFFFFFLCSFPSVFIDRKQPVDIFLLWEKVGVMCINTEHISINWYHRHWFLCQVCCLSPLSLHTRSHHTPAFFTHCVFI